ncbi:hypothetical protein COY16_01120 [Candidatus Roizmanbacteria bacterium CG_4_10_14_0_2_um_filter_39_13]|uniref:Glycosyltransferase RgtA/B/C/D-like domain-containing protein n=1 Tax=Candidatus Roizmanbacteria bacterium CG_4_10_14_0_2_um_filter_39_13 TaxID=1974825 RepID=A0A2M7U0Z5_9BACT|nr:MAG: hypothetical protein COY16_01120 [Candidatus Roizmanbacteria bacterium CG_4_10_14_0_2_um_filter_39_13]
MIAKKSLLKFGLWAMLIVTLIYTRFVGLDWGLPYPMHPDERNMVNAILGMTCHEGWNIDCLNPHFYAYGQIPLFIGYFFTTIASVWTQSFRINFNETVLSLRFLSAVSSVLTVFVMTKVAVLLSKKTSHNVLIALITFIFSPVFIQFAHFGTTESLLMLFVSILIYFAVLFIQSNISLSRYVLWSGVIFGLAVSTKVSSVFFAAIPILAICITTFNNQERISVVTAFFSLIKIAFLAVIVFVVTSPYNLFDWEAFVHSMNYESSVGIGTYKAFYTRQFEYTMPLTFQFIHVFPYALGIPIFMLSIFGFFSLPWNKTHIMLRLTAIALFIPNAFMYAKWSRFYSPVFPVVILIGCLVIIQLIDMNLRIKIKIVHTVHSIVLSLVVIAVMIYGMAYVSIYRHPDVRFRASQWIYENIPASAHILSETANVVDIPMPNSLIDYSVVNQKNLNPISFDFYEVGNNEILEHDLDDQIKSAEYIFVPSRRIFWNHSCLKSNNTLQNIRYSYEESRCESLEKEYPLQTAYYQDLFSGTLGFKQVAEFQSYPRIELFGQILIEFPDEAAEETWTVFDHPVIRIYQRK